MGALDKEWLRRGWQSDRVRCNARYHTKPATVMLANGAMRECHSVEHTPLGQDHTFARDAFAHWGCVAGCTGREGLSCSTHPQLFSVQVPLPVAQGGNHS